MLIGPDWLIEHLRKPKGMGNTLLGRSIVNRAKAEAVVVTVRCDVCGSDESVGMGARLRHLVNMTVRHESKYEHYKCQRCMREVASASRRHTINTPEFKAKIKERPSWQSQADPTTLSEWVQKGAATRSNTLAGKTPAQRSEGVRKQWATMSDDVKRERARKIGETSRAHWAGMTDDQRSARVERMIRGRPRSCVSDDFKAALLGAGLYDGFESEVAVSGFVADEVNVSDKIIIEFYGDYYHCNPRIYTDPNTYNTTLHMTAKDKWAYDRRRLAAFYKAGYRVRIVWESDWRKNPEAVLEGVRVFLAE